MLVTKTDIQLLNDRFVNHVALKSRVSMTFTLMILDVFILGCYIAYTHNYGSNHHSDERKALLRKFGNCFLFEEVYVPKHTSS
jgi:hypothetical protein